MENDIVTKRHADGSKSAKGSIVNGQLQGYWEWFRKDGTKKRSGYFDRGNPVGEWTTYDKNGDVYKVTDRSKINKVKNIELVPLFNELKAILLPYERFFKSHRDEPGYYDLWSDKIVEINGRKKKEVYFAGLIIQKNYVGFYYMPIYAEKDLAKYFEPELLATLKGKSCFYIKNNNPLIMSQIRKALDMGLSLYKERGWL